MGIQTTMKALADPTRRTILNLLKKRSLSAGEIAEHFSVSLPAVSKHLAVLKEADLIRDRREGKYIYYVEPEPETLGSVEITEKGFPWIWVVVVGGLVLAGIVVAMRKKVK